MGVECLAEWTLVEGQCCSTCPCDTIGDCELCPDGSEAPLEAGECCGSLDRCPVATEAPTYLVPDLDLVNSIRKNLNRDFSASRLKSAGQRAAALLQDKDEETNEKVAPLYDPDVNAALQKIRRFFKACDTPKDPESENLAPGEGTWNDCLESGDWSSDVFDKQRNAYNNIADALGVARGTW